MHNFFGGLLLIAVSALSVLAKPSDGCSKVASLQPNINSSIAVGNKTRQYILKLPDNYDNKHPYKLIFAFLPLYGSASLVANGGTGLAAYYGLPPLANNSAIFVSPNGQPEPPGGKFAGVMGWKNQDGEDILFIDAMLKTLLDDLCIDTDHIYSTGFRYGGAISYAIACARAKVFRAVGVLSGGTMSGCEGGSPKDPIAYYEQHGTHDQVLNISMARGMRDNMIKLNGCKPVSPEPTPPSGGHTKVAYEGCKSQYPLTWTVFDGDHTPSFKDNGSTSSFSPNLLWEFFSQFS